MGDVLQQLKQAPNTQEESSASQSSVMFNAQWRRVLCDITSTLFATLFYQIFEASAVLSASPLVCIMMLRRAGCAQSDGARGWNILGATLAQGGLAIWRVLCNKLGSDVQPSVRQRCWQSRHSLWVSKAPTSQGRQFGHAESRFGDIII